MIKVTELLRTYGDLKAVDNVSFEINKGEIVGLLGHNGAGKTTIMKMLTGFLDPSAGNILIDDLNIETDKLAIQQKIGYLPENVPLYSEMTVADYLEFVADLKSISNKKEAISAAIKKTSLQAKVNQRIDTLSKGFKQRVGVAQAILANPEILILDEPTNGLDPSQIQEMRNLIKELGQNSTIILSTHIMQEVEAVCDRVIILQQGKVALDSQMKDLKESKRVALAVDIDEASLKNLIKEITPVAECKFINNEAGVYNYTLILKERSAQVLPEIAKKIVANNSNLYKLSFEQESLESIFRSLGN